MERRSFILAALLGGALLTGVPSLAHAKPQARPSPPRRGLGDMLNLRPRDMDQQAPVAARYVADDVGFTFDRSGPSLRFEGAREIIVLVRQAAPQGGAVYLNDLGEPVLKVSGLGGMTLFTPERPQGMPVEFVSVTQPIRFEALIRPGIDMTRWVQSMSAQISRTVGPQSRIGIEAPALEQSDYQVLADVLMLTQQAVQRNARRERSRARMDRINTIWVERGNSPAVKVEGAVLRITIVPSKGVAGRPSSERIARALTR